MYRGTSLIRNSAPLGTYSRTMPRVIWLPLGGVRFLMSEVPLYTPLGTPPSFAAGPSAIPHPSIADNDACTVYSVLEARCAHHPSGIGTIGFRNSEGILSTEGRGVGPCWEHSIPKGPKRT